MKHRHDERRIVLSQRPKQNIYYEEKSSKSVGIIILFIEFGIFWKIIILKQIGKIVKSQLIIIT